MVYDNLLLFVQKINNEILPKLKSVEHKRVLANKQNIYETYWYLVSYNDDIDPFNSDDSF